MSDLVHKSADEVDETTLKLRQVGRFVSVHHGLQERNVVKAQPDVSTGTTRLCVCTRAANMINAQAFSVLTLGP